MFSLPLISQLTTISIVNPVCSTFLIEQFKQLAEFINPRITHHLILEKDYYETESIIGLLLSVSVSSLNPL